MRFHSRLPAILRRKVLAPWCTFYPTVGTRFHIDASPHGDAHPERRNPSDIRSQALQMGLTSYLKPIGLSGLDSFVSAVFASVYGLALQNLRHWGSLHGSSRIRIAGGALGVTSLGEPAGSNDSHPHVSIGQESAHWGSLHGSSRTRIAGGAPGLTALGEL